MSKHTLHLAQAQLHGLVSDLLAAGTAVIGVAEILGSVLDARNKQYADILKEKYPENYALFSREPGMVIVRVLPTSIAVFDKSDGQFCLKCLDLEGETAHMRMMTE